MSVSDSTVFVLLLCVINYLVIWRRNEFIGSVFFLGLGIGILTMLSSDEAWVGMFLLFIGFIAIIYSIFKR